MRQRSRVPWLRKGDRNTNYFNQFASARKRRNVIKKLRNNNNGWTKGNDNLSPLIRDYFDGLFHSDGVVCDQQLMQTVKTRVRLR